MKFEWDEQKKQANIQKHGIDFEDVKNIFGDVRLTAVDDRQAYGEIRKFTLGKIDGRLCVVVYTERNGVTRFVSARKANQ
ncbi:MAG: BrnT family toxin [Spirochaetaceae bacterium]|nr:BrnT family toxin [Spirochaetaceae bacterium]